MGLLQPMQTIHYNMLEGHHNFQELVLMGQQEDTRFHLHKHEEYNFHSKNLGDKDKD